MKRSPTATPEQSQIVFTQPFQAGTVPWGRPLEHYAPRHESVAYPPSLTSTHRASLPTRIKEGLADFRDGFRRHPGFVSADSASEGLTLSENWYKLPDPFAAAFNTANSPLSKKLGSRHLQVGMFDGPGSVMLCYTFVAVLMWCTMQALAELAVVYPVAGSFAAYSIRFIDPAWGFAQNYTYALAWAVTFPLELSVAVTVLEYWHLENVAPRAVWVTVFFAAIASFNLFGIRVFVEIENVFTTVKVFAVISFIILGITIDAAGGPGGSYLGAKTWTKPPGPFLNGITGVVSVFVNASFAFGGFEILGLAAAETSNPRRSIPAATKKSFATLTSFYLISLLIISFLVPFDDPGLTSDTSLVSPFVIAIERSGIMYLPDLFNAVVLVAVISVANTCVYACSRILAAIADQGQGPSAWRFIDKEGRPMKATILTLMFGFIAYVSALGYKTETEVFNWMLSICGLGSFFTWGSICLCHIRFRAAWKAQGNSIDQLAYRSQGGLFGSYLGLSLNIIVFLAVLWTALFTTDSWKPDIKNFMMTYLTVPIVIVQYFGYKLFFRTKILRVDKIDLVTGCIGLEDDRWVEERRAREADWPRWKKVRSTGFQASRRDLGPGLGGLAIPLTNRLTVRSAAAAISMEDRNTVSLESYPQLLENDPQSRILPPEDVLATDGRDPVFEWAQRFSADPFQDSILQEQSAGALPQMVIYNQDAPYDFDDGSLFHTPPETLPGIQSQSILGSENENQPTPYYGDQQSFPSVYGCHDTTNANLYIVDPQLNPATGDLSSHVIDNGSSELCSTALQNLSFPELGLPHDFDLETATQRLLDNWPGGESFDLTGVPYIDTTLSESIGNGPERIILDFDTSGFNGAGSSHMDSYWLAGHSSLGFPYPSGQALPELGAEGAEYSVIDSDATIDLEEIEMQNDSRSSRGVSTIGDYLVKMTVPPKEQHGISSDPNDPIKRNKPIEDAESSAVPAGEKIKKGSKPKRGRGRPIVPGSKRQKRIQAMAQPDYVPPKRGRPRTSERHLRKRSRRAQTAKVTSQPTENLSMAEDDSAIQQEADSVIYYEEELRYKPIYFILSAAQALKIQEMYNVPAPKKGWAEQDLRWQITYNLQRVSPTGSFLIRELTEHHQHAQLSAASEAKYLEKENQAPTDPEEADNTNADDCIITEWRPRPVLSTLLLGVNKNPERPRGCHFPDKRLRIATGDANATPRAMTQPEVLEKLLDERDVYFRAIVWEIVKGSSAVAQMEFIGTMNRMMGTWDFV
ncbi:General amino acid permease [Drechslerella dactyloides]|uniref:General amino acid permease n=1 Tax=Drechslerella dactyloides TaxID=74499 RepID=A0AAD6NHP6_DREDA|nr:General amino acid permease [Drechslerella dactyloides]